MFPASQLTRSPSSRRSLIDLRTLQMGFEGIFPPTPPGAPLYFAEVGSQPACMAGQLGWRGVPPSRRAMVFPGAPAPSRLASPSNPFRPPSPRPECGARSARLLFPFQGFSERRRPRRLAWQTGPLWRGISSPIEQSGTKIAGSTGNEVRVADCHGDVEYPHGRKICAQRGQTREFFVPSAEYRIMVDRWSLSTRCRWRVMTTPCVRCAGSK